MAEDRRHIRRKFFAWIQDPNQDRRQDHRTITIPQVVDGYGVPRKYVENYINQEIAQLDAFVSLFFTLLLIGAYTAVVITHDNAPGVMALESTLSTDMVANSHFNWLGEHGFNSLFDVNSEVDFWSWMVHGLTPLFWSKGMYEPITDLSHNASNFWSSFSSYERGLDTSEVFEHKLGNGYMCYLSGWSNMYSYALGFVRGYNVEGDPPQAEVAGLLPGATYRYATYQSTTNLTGTASMKNAMVGAPMLVLYEKKTRNPLSGQWDIKQDIFWQGNITAGTSNESSASGTFVAPINGRVIFRWPFKETYPASLLEGAKYEEILLSGLAIARVPTARYAENISSITNTSLAPYKVEEFNASARGVNNGVNRIIGGIRLRQERNDERTLCKTREDLLDIYNIKCVDGKKYEVRPTRFAGKSTAAMGEESKWMQIHQDAESIQEQLVKLETEGWLNEKTMKVEVAIPVYNPELRIHALLYVNFFFSRGGQIFKQVIPSSMYANWQDTNNKMFSELVWVVCLMILVVVELIKIGRIVTTKGVFRLVAEYATLWNSLEWFGVFSGFVICLMFLYLLTYTRDLNDTVEQMTRMKLHREWPEYKVLFEDGYFETLEIAIDHCSAMRVLMAGYPLVMLLRMFRSFSAQPRLAIVLSTLSVAWVDIFHFMISFFAVLLIFSIFAVVLFGKSLDAFTTLGSTFQTVFLAMLGLFEWQELKVVGVFNAACWLWSFMVVVNFLLLNMILSIVTQAYEEVRRHNQGCPPIWTEFKEAFKRALAESQGDVVAMKVIMKAIQNEVRRIAALQAEQEELELEGNALEEAGIDIGETGIETCPHKINALTLQLQAEKAAIDTVTVDGLVALVPNIARSQALDLLLNSCALFVHGELLERKVVTYDDIDDGVMNLTEAVDYLLQETCAHPESACKAVPSDITYDIRTRIQKFWGKLGSDSMIRSTADPNVQDSSLVVYSQTAGLLTQVERPEKSRQEMLVEQEHAKVKAKVKTAVTRVADLEDRIVRLLGERRDVEVQVNSMQERAAVLADENRILEALLPKSTQKPPLDGGPQALEKYYTRQWARS